MSRVRDLTPQQRTAVVHGWRLILQGAATDETVAALLRAPELMRDRAGRRRVATTLYRASALRLRLRALAPRDDAEALLDALDVLDAPAPADLAALHPLERLSVLHSCPRWLVERLVQSLGHEGTAAFLQACNRPGPKTLRANTLRITREALAQELRAEGIGTRPGALSPWALHVVEDDDDDAPRANLRGSRAFAAGLFEVQDESSQWCALACQVQPGDVVVDLCAGHGGKALALAACMEDRGALWLHDVDDGALAQAQGRLRRAGVSCARRGLPPAGSADVVLVDAPCSSLGPLRRSVDLRYRLQAEELDALPALQRALLAQGAALARPGGRVIYATCTVLRAENEDVAGSAGLELTAQRLLLPHVEGCDGFFVAQGRRG